MKIFFQIPYTTYIRCFLPEDMQRLDRSFTVTTPTEDIESGDLNRLAEEYLPEAEILVTGWGTPPLIPGLLDKAKNLSVIVHSAGSVKRLLPQDFWERNIRIATMNDALAIGVAETTLGMIIAGFKNLFQAREWTQTGGWSSMTFGDGRPSSRETYRSVIGIISASKVGRHLIRLLKNFDVKVLVYDPFLSQEEASRLGVTSVSLMQVARESDVVTIHAPSLPETEGLIGAEFLHAMRDNAIFINTARGTIVDEAALIAELQGGRINAFIDVTTSEPPDKVHPFRTLRNVILTPHIAGAVTNGCWRQGADTVQHILDFAAGKALQGEVIKAQFAVMA